MDRALEHAYRRLGRRYPLAVVVLQLQLAHVVVLGGLLLLRLYQPMSTKSFVLLLVIAELLVVVDNASATVLARRLLAPVDAWLAGARDRAATIAAWRALAFMPSTYARRARTAPALLLSVPFCAFATWELGLPAYAFAALLVVMLLILGYGALFRFFAMESLLRPVLADVALGMPDDFEPGRAGVPLKRRLLVGLPAINVLTGAIVAGMALNREDTQLADLGPAVVIAVLVAFVVALELTILLSRSIFGPLDALREATDRVRRGDLRTRVPVISADETGRLARSFNDMVAGLEERERLHEAFGAYVGPSVAEMVLRDGPHLDGEELEVSVLFLDIRDFTRFAERASAREVVDRLNEFYGEVVPLLVRHGGYPDKYVGDGLLGVFGAPEPIAAHADRAVGAAIEIAAFVRDRWAGELRVGIGVNSGPVIAGTIGGGGHVEFTVIGDTVNTAARVEQLTRQTGDAVLITEETQRRLHLHHGGLDPRPAAPLKGKRERVQLWAPRALAEGMTAPEVEPAVGQTTAEWVTE